MCFRPAAAKLNRCYECGKVNKPTATVCIECGAELAPGKEPCPQCKTLKDPMAVCPNCGAVPEVECPKCGKKNPITNEQCEHCGFKAPKMPGAGAAPKMPPPAGMGSGPVPPKAPPAPPKPPAAPPKKPVE